MTRLMTSINQSVRTRELFRLWLQVGTDNSGAHWERKWREQTTVRPRYIGHVGYVGCARYDQGTARFNIDWPRYRALSCTERSRYTDCVGFLCCGTIKVEQEVRTGRVKVQCVKRVKCKCFVAYIQRNDKRIEYCQCVNEMGECLCLFD